MPSGNRPSGAQAAIENPGPAPIAKQSNSSCGNARPDVRGHPRRIHSRPRDGARLSRRLIHDGKYRGPTTFSGRNQYANIPRTSQHDSRGPIAFARRSSRPKRVLGRPSQGSRGVAEARRAPDRSSAGAIRPFGVQVVRHIRNSATPRVLRGSARNELRAAPRSSNAIAPAIS